MAARGQTDKTSSNIEAVSGLYAWNEDMSGAEIGPTKGKTIPTPGTMTKGHYYRRAMNAHLRAVGAFREDQRAVRLLIVGKTVSAPPRVIRPSGRGAFRSTQSCDAISS